MNYCKYCGGKGNFQLRNESWCCSKSQNSCPAIKKKNKESHTGKPGGMKGKSAWNKGMTKETDERIRKHSILMTIVQNGDKGPNWVGGCYDWWHEQAWNLFGKDVCEICGKTNKDEKQKTGKRLSIHCVSGEYKILERKNWTTTCRRCHGSFLDANRFIVSRDSTSGRFVKNE